MVCELHVHVAAEISKRIGIDVESGFAERLNKDGGSELNVENYHYVGCIGWTLWLEMEAFDSGDGAMLSEIDEPSQELSSWLGSVTLIVKKITWCRHRMDDIPEVIMEMISRPELEQASLEFPSDVNRSIRHSLDFALPWMMERIEAMAPVFACQSALAAATR